MIDVKFIDKSFVQKGDVCVLASYSIITECFSSKKISIQDIFQEYNKIYNVVSDPTLAKVFKEKKINVQFYFENEIFIHFHKICKSKNWRGYEFIKHIHDNNILNTQSFSTIQYLKADIQYIGDKDKGDLTQWIESEDTIAMILYPVDCKKSHSIVIGTDLKNKPFYRDPERAGFKLKDGLKDKNVTEYIVFHKK